MKVVSLSDCMWLEDKNSGMELEKVDCGACNHESEKIAVENVLYAVIRNELTEVERKAVTMYWFDNKKVASIASSFGVTPKSVRCTLERANKKIYNNLKYVVMYNSIVGTDGELPDSFRFKIINVINGKELIS